MTEFSLDLAKELVASNDEFPVDFEQAYVWLEYSRKDVAKRAFLNVGFIENVDFKVFHTSAENSQGGRPTEIIKLTVDCFKQWGMVCGNDKGKQIRLYFLECEKVAKQVTNIPAEMLQFMQTMQSEMRLLRERTEKLDIVQEEKQQLASELQDRNTLLKLLDEAGYEHQGCYNIVNQAVVSPKQRLFTAFKYLDHMGYDTGFANILARRAAAFYRTSKKIEPHRDADNNLLFEESYLAEVYEALKQVDE
jgi:phage anti-repressor protein